MDIELMLFLCVCEQAQLACANVQTACLTCNEKSLAKSFPSVVAMHFRDFEHFPLQCLIYIV